MTYTFLKGGLLIDGNGNAPIENAGVLINDGEIMGVGDVSQIEVPEGTEVIELDGQVIMPGLIDAHVHILGGKSINAAISALEPIEMQMGRALNDLPKLYNAGFTSVRDAGSSIAVHVRRLIEDGEYVGPRIQTSNQMLSQTGGRGDIPALPLEFIQNRTCDGVEECMKAAREQFRAGADYIKICSTGGVLSESDDPHWPQFTVDEIKAIVYEAEAVDSYVASHAQGTQGIKNALLAGVKTIEHGIYLDDETIDMMLKQSAILVPTLSIVKRVIDEGHKHGVPEVGLQKARRVYEVHKQSMKKAHEAGIEIAMGTDFNGSEPVAHGGNALELELLVEYVGMSPMEAIVASTKNAAKALMKDDEIGTIEKGKKADIIIVDGQPLEDIKILSNPNNIKKVFINGDLVKNIT